MVSGRRPIRKKGCRDPESKKGYANMGQKIHILLLRLCVFL